MFRLCSRPKLGKVCEKGSLNDCFAYFMYYDETSSSDSDSDEDMADEMGFLFVMHMLMIHNILIPSAYASSIYYDNIAYPETTILPSSKDARACVAAVIDANGDKNPNYFGKDIFMFQFTLTGTALKLL